MYPTFTRRNTLKPTFSPPVLEAEEVKARLLAAAAAGGMRGLGLPGQKSVPSKAEVLSVIPKELLRPNTARSLAYAALSLGLTVVCAAVARTFIPMRWAAAPLWAAHAIVTGSVAMGCWVLAHECGHGAFSENKALQFAVGFTFHSALLVPYLSWQRTHAVHHLKVRCFCSLGPRARPYNVIL